MKITFPALAIAVALGISANVALAQETGFGGQPDASKNQVPAPSATHPTDPEAGVPGSAAQIPTAPEVQDDLYGTGTTSTAEAGAAASMKKPYSSDPH